MERNRDKIKRLEYELGRREKKIGDQGKELERLRERLDVAEAGKEQMQMVMDAILTAIVLAYGTQVHKGERLLHYELPSAAEMLKQYKLEASRNKATSVHVLRVTARREGK